MIYKKIDITQAALSNIDEDTAKEFVDHRVNIKKPLRIFWEAFLL